MTVNGIQVREIDAPADDVAVEWLLVTTLPIGTADQAREAIAYYCVRWAIEVFFRTLWGDNQPPLGPLASPQNNSRSGSPPLGSRLSTRPAGSVYVEPSGTPKCR